MALGERSREQEKEERWVGARDVSASPVPGMFLLFTHNYIKIQIQDERNLL
jgi:hypothetical protein